MNGHSQNGNPTKVNQVSYSYFCQLHCDLVFLKWLQEENKKTRLSEKTLPYRLKYVGKLEEAFSEVLFLPFS